MEKDMIINETVYDRELLNEAAKYLTRRYKFIIGAVSALLILMACFDGVVLKAGKTTVVIPLVGIALVLVTGIVRIRQYKIMLINRLITVNHNDRVSCKYEIDDEKIIATLPNGINTLEHKDIKKIIESDKIYLIIYNGGVFIIVSKAGFKEGERPFDGIKR